jgi:type I restriction enzyme, R subunit
MPKSTYSENNLVRDPLAEYLEDDLQWDENIYAEKETDGDKAILGRSSHREVILTRYLLPKLQELNPGLPAAAYAAAIRQLEEASHTPQDLTTNRHHYHLLRDGVRVEYRDTRGELQHPRLHVFDFQHPTRNHFLVVREFWVSGPLHHRRLDVVGFINGIPLLVVECKNVTQPLRTAYEKNLRDYFQTIPHLFNLNAFLVITNGSEARVGTLGAGYKYFHEWRRLREQDPGNGPQLETLLSGICSKANLLDLFQNFILFDDSSGRLVKILARNHQYLGVNLALQAVRERHQRQGKLGVFWHTQGSGKSYSMVFFSEKVRRREPGNFTFLVATDRRDLNDQIYKTYVGCGVVASPKGGSTSTRPDSGKDLRRLLAEDHPYLFTLINLFNQDLTSAADAYTQRPDVIVLSDEAHRSQAGRYAEQMRLALPTAQFLGFTGTPLMTDDQVTRRIFGDYVSVYDFQRAVQDGATVPLYFESRGEKLNLSRGEELSRRIAERVEEFDDELDPTSERRLREALAQDYPILTAESRLQPVAADIVAHYVRQYAVQPDPDQLAQPGKAMVVSIDKITAVRMYQYVRAEWDKTIAALTAQVATEPDPARRTALACKLTWMQETILAPVISDEQNEITRFLEWDIDIKPHRELIIKGFPGNAGHKSLPVDLAFKDDHHPFRIAFVCAMWLTGFDVPSLGTLYLDKPLKAHTLMQAIARANRVYEGKSNGLIVDYCASTLKNLRAALATYATGAARTQSGPGTSPIHSDAELLTNLDTALTAAETVLTTAGFSFSGLLAATKLDRAPRIVQATERLYTAGISTVRRFEILTRDAFARYRACFNKSGLDVYIPRHDALRAIYLRLLADREPVDIGRYLHELQGLVAQHITPHTDPTAEPLAPFDISQIDFARLRHEFARNPAQQAARQRLQASIEARLRSLLNQNPTRIDLVERYEAIIAAYNQEKDRPTIEQTFDQLLNFIQELSAEETRAIREGLTEEELALFDLLLKPDLKPAERERVKQVAQDLLATLQAEKLDHDLWRENETTREGLRSFLHTYLYADTTGLPDPTYSAEEVKDRSLNLYHHFYQQTHVRT